MNLIFRELQKNEFHKIGEIDRSDFSAKSYCCKNGSLELVMKAFKHPGYDGKRLEEKISSLNGQYERVLFLAYSMVQG